jgi:hypothetical protein
MTSKSSGRENLVSLVIGSPVFAFIGRTTVASFTSGRMRKKTPCCRFGPGMGGVEAIRNSPAGLICGTARAYKDSPSGVKCEQSLTAHLRSEGYRFNPVFVELLFVAKTIAEIVLGDQIIWLRRVILKHLAESSECRSWRAMFAVYIRRASRSSCVDHR